MGRYIGMLPADKTDQTDQRGGLLSVMSVLSAPEEEGIAPAHQALAEAVEAIATKWNALPQGHRPELDPEEDRRLEADINAAFRSGDLQAAMQAVQAWRGGWERLLPDRATAPSPTCGHKTMWRSSLDREVVRCEVCHPPAVESYVAERIVLDGEAPAPPRRPEPQAPRPPEPPPAAPRVRMWLDAVEEAAARLRKAEKRRKRKAPAPDGPMTIGPPGNRVDLSLTEAEHRKVDQAWVNRRLAELAKWDREQAEEESRKRREEQKELEGEGPPGGTPLVVNRMPDRAGEQERRHAEYQDGVDGYR